MIDLPTSFTAFFVSFYKTKGELSHVATVHGTWSMFGSNKLPLGKTNGELEGRLENSFCVGSCRCGGAE